MDTNMRGYYHDHILQMTKMKDNNEKFDLIDICNSCAKEKECKKGLEARISFARDYFAGL